MKDKDENNQADKNPGNFGLPEGYFQTSANAIVEKIAWQEEHKSFPTLLSVRDGNGFTLPVTYFSKSEVRLELIQYAGLATLEKQNPFSVPLNYFEKPVLKEREKISEGIEAFTRLGAIGKENTFAVPPNYFRKNAELLAKLLNPRPAKVISLFRKALTSTAAALLILALGTWLYYFYFVPVQVQDCGTIACLDRQDLIKSTNLERFDDDELYDLVDPSALEKKLETTDTKKTNSPADKNKKNKPGSMDTTEDLFDDL